MTTPEPKEFRVTTICGSMRRYRTRMLDEAEKLSLEGWIVLMPFITFGQSLQSSAEKEMLDRMHFAKIDRSDAIHVVGGMEYIGESTAKEVAYAASIGKAIYYR